MCNILTHKHTQALGHDTVYYTPTHTHVAAHIHGFMNKASE